MKTLSIREMRNLLGQLDTVVLESGEVTVTRNGKPIARVMPLPGQKPKPNHADLRNQMQPLTTASESLVRIERDER